MWRLLTVDSLFTGIQAVAFTILGALPIGYIFPYIGWMLLAYFAYCSIPCLILKNRSSITILIYLVGLEATAWVGFTWSDSLNMLFAHGLLLSFLVVSHVLYSCLGGKFCDRFLQYSTLLVMIDAIAVASDSMLFVHQSFVNVLFFLMCYSARTAGKNSLEILTSIKNQPDTGNNAKLFDMQYRQKMRTSLMIPFAHRQYSGQY